MKLLCTIEPNEDGFVLAEFEKNVSYQFDPDENGDLVAEVDNDKHVAHLIATGNFQPYDEADFSAATDILSSDENENGDEGNENDLDQVDLNAGPVEALTPASNKKPRKAQAE